MEDAKLIDTLMPTNGNLENNETVKDVDVKKYRECIRHQFITEVILFHFYFSVL